MFEPYRDAAALHKSGEVYADLRHHDGGRRYVRG